MAKRIQLSRKKGYRKPADAVNVARPTKWGNPYKIVKSQGLWWVRDTLTKRAFGPELSKEAAATRATNLYERTLSEMLKQAARDELRGKDLACYCPPEQMCHADVLLELANGEAEPERKE